MKKVACILIEIGDNETVETIVKKVEESLKTGTKSADKTQQKKSVYWFDRWRERLINIMSNLGIETDSIEYRCIFWAMEYIDRGGNDAEFNIDEIYHFVAGMNNMTFNDVQQMIARISKDIYYNNERTKVEEVLRESSLYHPLNNDKLIKAIAAVVLAH